MSARAIIGIVSFCVGVAGVFFGNTFMAMMISEINRKRQDGNQVPYFGFTFPKMLKIFGEYRSSYPNGNAHIYVLVAFALVVIGVAVCVRIIG